MRMRPTATLASIRRWRLRLSLSLGARASPRLGFVPFLSPHATRCCAMRTNATLRPWLMRHPTATRPVLPRRGCVRVAHRHTGPAGRARSPPKPRPPRYSLLPGSSWRGGQWRVRAAATHEGRVAAPWFPLFIASQWCTVQYSTVQGGGDLTLTVRVRRVRLGLWGQENSSASAQHVQNGTERNGTNDE